MGKVRYRNYCTIDHANKRRELARQTPYQFWLRQVKRNRTVDADAERDRNAGTFHTGFLTPR